MSILPRSASHPGRCAGQQNTARPLTTSIPITAFPPEAFRDRVHERSVAVIVGTRPEAVKMSAIIHRLGDAALLVHTGQHYSDALWAAVSGDLGLPPADAVLSVGGKSRARQIGDAVGQLGDLLSQEENVQAVLVHGDTNATLAGALAANAEGLQLYHVEAGLRSRDRRMPEEHNRVLVDHLADHCFAPTAEAAANLRAEGVDEARLTVTGNTIVEVVRELLPTTRARHRICAARGVMPRGFVLATLHRPENTDDPVQLSAVLSDLRTLPLPVVLPLHPRTRRLVPDSWLDGLSVVEPLAPREFLGLLAESALVVTDSGGIQEEVTILRRPALVVRRSSERPESMGAWCELVQPGWHLRELAQQRLANPQATAERCSGPTPFGDGLASERVVAHVLKHIHAEAPMELSCG